MAAFTTIASATVSTVSIGGSIAEGAIAGDAAKVAARESGRLRLEQERLEKESVARLEENFYSAVRATTDVYDRQLRGGNAFAAQLLESVQEGDQRGVAAGAGKIKQAQDATLGATADKFAEQKLKIDFAEAQAGELSASEIAAFQDDRAASAGQKADALTAQAGVSAAEGMEGKATNKAIETLGEDKVSKMTFKEIRNYNKLVKEFGPNIDFNQSFKTEEITNPFIDFNLDTFMNSVGGSKTRFR